MRIYIEEETEEHTRIETDGYTIFVSGSIEKQREMCILALLKLFTNEN